MCALQIFCIIIIIIIIMSNRGITHKQYTLHDNLAGNLCMLSINILFSAALWTDSKSNQRTA